MKRAILRRGNDSNEASREGAFSPADPAGRFWGLTAPLIFAAMYVAVGLFFRRAGMGDPDSYRQALSALSYIEEGVYSSYWDFPLTMYFFVAGTRLALVLGMSQLAVLNTIAVLLGAATVWPFYQLVRSMVNRQAAVFATIAYILSPTLIRYSTYLSHEIVGFTFALWSVYLFERTLKRRDRLMAFSFGLFFGAAYAARTNGAVFIVPPLLVLLVHTTRKSEIPNIVKLLLFSLLGFGASLITIHRPVTVLRFVARLRIWFFTYYEIGQFAERTTLTALESLTPALAALAVAGAVVLFARRRGFLAVFGGVWILTVYLFYVGMDICRLKFFLVVVPPCLLLAFAGADQIDERFPAPKSLRHAAKWAAVLLLLLVGLGPSLTDLLYLRKVNDDKVAAEGIGEVVGRNLLFITSFEPMVQYYNRENPPETIYLVTEHRPGEIKMKLDGLRLAVNRLQEGNPVFATEVIIPHLQSFDIDATVELVWEYKSMQLFRITSLSLPESSTVGQDD